MTEERPRPNKRQLGREAEDRAAAYLLGKGYTLVTRRYKGRHGEIDLVCLDGDQLVFVEVKAWSAPGYRPEEAIDLDKVRALQRVAQEYLERVSGDRDHRFDLVAIDRKGLRHHPNFLAED